MDAFNSSWFIPFLTPVFHALSLYVSLPSEFENITRRNSRFMTKQKFCIYPTSSRDLLAAGKDRER